MKHRHSFPNCARLLPVVTFLVTLWSNTNTNTNRTNSYFASVEALSLSINTNTNYKPFASLQFELQQCTSPRDILQSVACKLSQATADDSSIASLVMIRLAKQLIAIDNNKTINDHHLSQTNQLHELHEQLAWNNVCSVLATGINGKMTPTAIESAVEGLKAVSIISRLAQTTFLPSSAILPILDNWDQWSDNLCSQLLPHHLTGIKWAYDTLALSENINITMPFLLQQKYNQLQIPFRIYPACLEELDLNITTLMQQVDFFVDTIRTTSSNEVVTERRSTAWQGDDGVAPFSYSGKSMPTQSWSPMVLAVRDALYIKTGQYYNGCLLNLYPNGESAMRYHVDPDQGILWDTATAVVSVGATRKFAFRDIPSSRQPLQPQPHNFVVMEGDVTEMINDCQILFQHTVKTADDKYEKAPRASMVFKRTL